jgi:hypothetical protein
MTTVNVNAHNYPIKRHRLENWIKKKQDLTIAVYKKHTSLEKTNPGLT